MEKEKSIKKNMFMNVILTSANFIFPMITFGYVSRVISPVGTGKVAFVNSILGYFAYISTLGVPAYGRREVAKTRDDYEELSVLVQELLIVSLVATLVCYIFLGVAVLMIDKLWTYKSLFAIMSCSIILNTVGVEWLYQGLENYEYITVRSLLVKSLSVILTFVLVKSESDILWYGFLTVLTSSLNYVFNFLNLKNIVTLKKIRPYNIKRHMEPIIVLFSSSIVLTLYNNFDISMLGFISSDKEVGLYNAALKIKNIVLSLSSALTSVLIPRISMLFDKGKISEVKLLLKKSLQFSFLLSVPVTVFSIIYSEDILHMMAGLEYAEASESMRILLICIFPLIFTNVFGNQVLIPSGHEKRYSFSMTIGLLINVILNILLIPLYGATGAAIGTLATEIWNVYWMSGGEKSIRQFLLKNMEYRVYILSLLVSSVVSMLTYRILIKTYNSIIMILVLGIIYIITYYIVLLILGESIVVQTYRTVKSRLLNWTIK